MLRRLVSASSVCNYRALTSAGAGKSTPGAGAAVRLYGGRHAAGRPLAVGSTSHRCFATKESQAEAAAAESSPKTSFSGFASSAASSSDSDTLSSVQDAAFVDFMAAHEAAQTSDEIYGALANYCAQAPVPSKRAISYTLGVAQQRGEASLMNRVLRLSLALENHLSQRQYVYCLRITLPEADIALMFALLKHELPFDRRAAAAVFDVLTRAVHQMKRSDSRFVTLVHDVNNYLSCVRDDLPPARLSGAYSLLATMMAEIEEYDAALELLHARRNGNSPIPDRVLGTQLSQLCHGAATDRALELFTNAPEWLGSRPLTTSYRSMLSGLRFTRRISEILLVGSMFVRDVQNDHAMFVPAGIVLQIAKGIDGWLPTDAESKQAVLLLRLLFNAVITGHGKVEICADAVGEALRLLGDSDGAMQLFEARNDWATVDSSQPFFELRIDPSIELTARPWLEKPLISQTQLANAQPNPASQPLLKNSAASATTQAQILIDRGLLDAAFDLIQQYPNADQHALVRRAVDSGGPEVGLQMMNAIERATNHGARLHAAFPVLEYYFKNHRDAEAHAILEQFRRRGSTLDKSIKSGLLFNAIARDGRDVLADQMFENLNTMYRHEWCHAASFTLLRWYHERKLDRFDALSKFCLNLDESPLPARLWRTIATLNYLLGEREETVAAALAHDGGRATYRKDFTLQTMGKLVQIRLERNDMFLGFLE